MGAEERDTAIAWGSSSVTWLRAPTIGVPIRPGASLKLTVGPNRDDRIYKLHKCSALASFAQIDELASVQGYEGNY